MICSDELGSEIRQWVWTRSEVQILWQLFIWNKYSTLVLTFIFNKGSLDQCITGLNCPKKIAGFLIFKSEFDVSTVFCIFLSDPYCILNFFIRPKSNHCLALLSQSILVVRVDWCDPGLWLKQPFKVMQLLLAFSYRTLPNQTHSWSLACLKLIFFSRIWSCVADAGTKHYKNLVRTKWKQCCCCENKTKAM